VRAAIDWSYDLLTPQEQTLFLRLGIFAGGFGLEAASKVCGGEGLDEIDILDLLASLTDKSLVVADTTGQQERYRLLESTRAYALQKLEAGQRERLARRHAEHYVEKAQEADQRYGTGSTFAWLDDVGLELDNYRAALGRGLTQGNDAVLGGVIAGSLQRFWRHQGLTVEGRYWIDSALERVNVAKQPKTVARLLRAQAHLFDGSRTCEAAARAVEIYESMGDHHGAAHTRYDLAYGLYQMGRFDEAMKVITQALTVMRECKDQLGIATCLNNEAVVAVELGKFAEARDLRAQALATFKTIGDEIGTARILNGIAELEFADGHSQEALRAVSEALAIHQRRRVHSINLAIYNNNIAAYRIALDDLDGAAVSAREGLRIARQVQSAIDMAIVMQHLALLAALQRHPQAAVRLLGYVDAQFKALGYKRESTEKWGYDKLMNALREQLSEAEIEQLAAEGAAWLEDQAVEEALKE
jgi:tetratricopeptide (TPR) repeat protein